MNEEELEEAQEYLSKLYDKIAKVTTPAVRRIIAKIVDAEIELEKECNI